MTDPLLLLKALILGIVEGLTEFLPISSTGHMIIVGDLLDYTGPQAKVFEIVIQFAAILAVCWLYRARLLQVVADMWRPGPQQRLAINVLVAFMPAAVLGFLFHDAIKHYLFNPLTVAGALIVGLLESFSSFWASAFKEVIVLTLIIPVLWWRSLHSHHVEDEE